MVQDNDDIIELTDKVTEDASENEDQGIIELTELAPTEGQPKEEADLESPLILDESPLEISDGKGDDAPSEAIAPVDQERFEAALERVVEKKFSQTIEKILFEVVEKVVQKEIAEIKASLEKELDGIGKP